MVHSKLITVVPELLVSDESKDENSDSNFMAKTQKPHGQRLQTGGSRLLLLLVALFIQRVRLQVQGQDATQHAFIEL